jgi:hypothetical protein
MESLRYVLACLACGVIAVWAGENMFWFIPPEDLRPTDLALTVIAYSVASGVGLSLVILSGLRGLPAAFLGGAVMGYMVEGVIVGTIYDPLPFFWVWTPLAWHALISGGLVLGLGRAAGVLGPVRMALIWGALGLASAFWAQYWPSESEVLPGRAVLALYLVGFGGLVVLAQVGLDRIGHLPQPPKAVLWIAPGIALAVWVAQGVTDLNPLRVLLPLVMALLWWIMRRLGEPGSPVPLGGPVPVWHHALVLIAPTVAVALAPLGWAQGWGTLGANIVVAAVTCLLSLVWLGRLVWRARSA